MPVISQLIIDDSAQADGRRHIRYEFTDHTGAKHYKQLNNVPADFNADADLLASVAGIEADLARQETAEYVKRLGRGDTVLTPAHQTDAQLKTSLFTEFFSSADVTDVLNGIVQFANVLTDQEIKDATGFNQGGVNQFRSQITDLENAIIAIEGW